MENVFFELFTSFGSIFSYLLKAFSPIVLGLLFAYLLNEPVDWIDQKLHQNRNPFHLSEVTKGRGMSILVAYVTLFFFFSSIIFSFVYLIIGAFPKGDIFEIIDQICSYFNAYVDADLFDIKSFTNSWINRFFSFNNIFDILTSASGVIINIFLGIVCSIYLLKDKAFFLMLWQKVLSLFLDQKTHGIVNEVLHEINLVLSTFIKGAVIDSILVALLSSIVLTILKIKFAVVIGIIGGILNIIPYFGPFLAMIPAFLVAITTQSFSKAIITVIALFLIQQLDSNYIYPKVVGSSTGLHPLYILISVSVMGYFVGVIGMLLAVPIASIIQVIIKKWISYL